MRLQTYAKRRVDLLNALTDLFDDEELKTLCFELPSVDYDSLRGEGKVAKARELIRHMERTGHFEELEKAVHDARSRFFNYSPRRTQDLQASILSTAGGDVRGAFVEFTYQIEAYLSEFNLLYMQLQEWKEVHNLLQDVQTIFAPCRSYIFVLSRVKGSGHATQEQGFKMLYEVEVEWRPCRRSLSKFKELAASIHITDVGGRTSLTSVRDWLRQLAREAAAVDRALGASNVGALAEHLSAFGDRVDRFLYLADRSLRDVVCCINQLPRPGVHKVKQP